MPSGYAVDSYLPISYKVTGYTPASYSDTYSVDKTAHDYISSYTHHDAVYQSSCPGASSGSVCLGYKYTQEWDCWHDSEGSAFDNECNTNGVASSTSCKSEFKQVDALNDCNLDGRGTSCAAWAIVNGNMIYLDAKEVSW